MALDAYLVIANAQGDIVAGETEASFTDSFDPIEKFQGLIAVSTFSVGASDSVTLGIDGGAGKAQFSELVITRVFDKSSVPVMTALFEGQKFDGLQLLLVDAASRTVTLEFLFKVVFVVEVVETAIDAATDTEEVHFEFAAMEVRYETETQAWSVIDNSPDFNAPDLGPGVPNTGGGSGGGTTTTSSSTTTGSTTTTTGPGGSVPESPLTVALPVTAAAVVGGAAVWAARHRVAPDGVGGTMDPGGSEAPPDTTDEESEGRS